MMAMILMMMAEIKNVKLKEDIVELEEVYQNLIIEKFIVEME